MLRGLQGMKASTGVSRASSPLGNLNFLLKLRPVEALCPWLPSTKYSRSSHPVTNPRCSGCMLVQQCLSGFGKQLPTAWARLPTWHLDGSRGWVCITSLEPSGNALWTTASPSEGKNMLSFIRIRAGVPCRCFELRELYGNKTALTAAVLCFFQLV